MTMFWLGVIVGAGGLLGVVIIVIALLRNNVGPRF